MKNNISKYFKGQLHPNNPPNGGSSVISDQQKGQRGLKPETNPVTFEFEEFDHLQITSGNPKQSAFFYSTMFGFEIEQCEDIYQQSGKVSYYLRNGGVRFLISGQVSGDVTQTQNFLQKRGDAVSQVALRVHELAPVRTHLETKGISAVSSDLDNLQVLSMEIFPNVTHAFVERSVNLAENPDAPFWPGLSRESSTIGPLNNANEFFNQHDCGIPEFLRVDHVGFPQPIGESKQVIESYFENLGFYMFWSIDEESITSDQSSLKSTVVSDFKNKIRFPIFEPVPKQKKSQIQEFLDYNDGPGAQHVAIEVSDILTTVKAMRRRGVEFLPVNRSYYELVWDKLQEFGVEIQEDFSEIMENELLLDFDAEGNYLLQIFTKPLTDKPTMFLEFIQRSGHQGFGEGNFNRLFLSIEIEQKKRGNLV